MGAGRVAVTIGNFGIYQQNIVHISDFGSVQYDIYRLSINGYFDNFLQITLKYQSKLSMDG